jgi:hypothetical protein
MRRASLAAADQLEQRCDVCGSNSDAMRSPAGRADPELTSTDG